MAAEAGSVPPAGSQDAKLLRQEARSQAQGGRWLDERDVAKEPAEGYGVAHHHIKQTQTQEVKEALERGHDPGYVEADEKKREARALAQGGRWMDNSAMPHNLPKQTEQEEVKEAVAMAHSPEFLEEQKKAQEAKSQASGGRW